MELQKIEKGLEELRAEVSKEEWERLNLELMKSTVAAELKLGILLRGWPKEDGSAK